MFSNALLLFAVGLICENLRHRQGLILLFVVINVVIVGFFWFAGDLCWSRGLLRLRLGGLLPLNHRLLLLLIVIDLLHNNLRRCNLDLRSLLWLVLFLLLGLRKRLRSLHRLVLLVDLVRLLNAQEVLFDHVLVLLDEQASLLDCQMIDLVLVQTVLLRLAWCHDGIQISLQNVVQGLL